MLNPSLTRLARLALLAMALPLAGCPTAGPADNPVLTITSPAANAEFWPPSGPDLTVTLDFDPGECEEPELWVRVGGAEVPLALDPPLEARVPFALMALGAEGGQPPFPVQVEAGGWCYVRRREQLFGASAVTIRVGWTDALIEPPAGEGEAQGFGGLLTDGSGGLLAVTSTSPVCCGGGLHHFGADRSHRWSVWSERLPDGASLARLGDGGLAAIERTPGHSESHLLVVDAQGQNLRDVAIEHALGGPPVEGQDAALHLLVAHLGPTSVVSVATDDSLAWSTELSAVRPFSPLAIGPGAVLLSLGYATVGAQTDGSAFVLDRIEPDGTAQAPVSILFDDLAQPQAAWFLDDGSVVAIVRRRSLTLHDAVDGTQRWRYELASDYASVSQPPPVVESPDGAVLFAGGLGKRPDGSGIFYELHVVALDPASGDEQWHYTDPSVDASYPFRLAALADGGVAVLVGNRVLRLDAAGDLLWSIHGDTRGEIFVAGPVPCFDDRVCVATERAVWVLVHQVERE